MESMSSHKPDPVLGLKGVRVALLIGGLTSLIVIPIDYRENRLLTERLGDIACPI